jgi:hypothetical protein
MAFLLLLWCCSEKYKLYLKKDFILFFPPTSKNPLVSSGMNFIVKKNCENILEKIREPNNKKTLAL